MSHCYADRSFLSLVILLLITSPLAADDPTTDAAKGDAATPISTEHAQYYLSEVKPILAAHCFKCHGDEHELKGGLQLTNREAILAGGDSGSAVDLESPEDSVLMSAVNYEDYEMPPKGKLPPASIAILSRWVEMGIPIPAAEQREIHQHEEETPDFGALIKDYWAYQPLSRPQTPTVKQKDWVANPIDAFLLARLEAAGLSPAKPADKRTLIRRAYYDLTGLPPTLEEVEQFVNDDRPEAYRELVDRLLESPHYGEKWGRHWLDLVRYAETHGYERDSTKPFAWRYRDYVIQSLNDDKPYDQFLIEQLAGDEIDHPTAESMTATGFYRLGIWDDEPADRLQHKYDVLDDIVSTTSQVMLGMSLGCARCHDHKKDPIPQTDYYRMLGVFHDVTDMNRENLVQVFSDGRIEPTNVAKNKRLAEEETLRRELAGIEKEFAMAAAKETAGKQSDAPTTVYLADSRNNAVEWHYVLEKPTADWIEPGYDASQWTQAPGGFGNPGTPGSRVRTEWNTNDIWLRTTFLAKKIPAGLTLTIHHDEDVEIYLNGERIYQAAGYLREYQQIDLPGSALRALVTGRNVLAVHCHQKVGGQYIDVGLAVTGAKMPNMQKIASDGLRLLGEKRFGRYQQLQANLVKLKQQKAQPQDGVKVMAVGERGSAATHVLVRGNPHVPGDRVEPGVPLALGGLPIAGQKDRAPQETSGKRLQFARWLVGEQNPMAACAMANRLWQFHFGRAIVATPNDFGQLGAPPTHPDLLDWLAVELVERGWRLKAMHRLIMLSSAYQMDSGDRQHELAADPANELFWRFDMRRLTAEEIRDSILAVNGSLNLKRSGPSVYPKMPAEVLATSSRPNAAWGNSPPEEQNRRSIYVFVKRSLVHPMLANFDVADTDSTCAVRFATTVPTQSLAMLNSEFASEQAEVFAKRLRTETTGDVRKQVTRALELVLVRTPSDEEIQRGVAFIDRLNKQEQGDQHMGLRAFCLLALNLNEFVYLD